MNLVNCCEFEGIMHSIARVPKYLEKLIYAEADLVSSYRKNQSDKNRIQYGLIHLAVKKIFRGWYRDSKNIEAKRLMKNYIQLLVARGIRYRLCSKIGNLNISQVKYEATQCVILILLDIYKEMEEQNAISVRY